VAAKTFTRGVDLSGTLQGAGGIGGLLCFSDHTGPTTFHIDYHGDGNGNVTALVDRNQQVAARYLYDPFGSTLASTGPLAEGNLYRFSSMELHAQSGLIYYLRRYYEPALQRWVNRDPLGEKGGGNLMRFVGNAPTVAVDPFGLFQPSAPPGASLTGAGVLDLLTADIATVGLGTTVAAGAGTFAAGFGVGYLIGDATGLHDAVGNFLGGPNPDPSPLPLPPNWKIDRKRAKAESKCLKEIEDMNNACKKRGSPPLTKQEKKEQFEKCMEREGFPVKK